MGGTLTVPYPFDVIIDSQGYVFADTEEQKAAFGLTQPFVPRTNTQGDYGDNQQDFFHTWTQKDWSKGEEQKYQGRDDEGKARFWRGKNVDVTIPGEVTVRTDRTQVTFAANPKTAAPVSSGLVYFATSTNLYSIDSGGSISSIGAHGLGAAPSRWGLVGDPSNRYLSTTAGGTVGVRRETGAAFSTFSATPSDTLAFLNNALYGYRNDTGVLQRYSTAGAATTLFTWQDATGGGAGVESKIMAFGGKLLILRYRTAGPKGGELWLYDGTAPAKVAEFPPNFSPYDMDIVSGTVFVSGASSVQAGNKAIVLFYRDGQQGVHWESNEGQQAPITAFGNGLVIGDSGGNPDVGTPRLVFYNGDTGGFSTLNESSGLFEATASVLAAGSSFVLIVPSTSSGTTGYVWGGTGTLASSGIVDSSRIDFDSSLPKILRGIKVFFTSGGGTSSVDIAYSVDDGAFTTLQTGATTGTEYLITPNEGTTHNFVQVRVTLNPGSGNSPKLKRIQARAVPVQTAFKKRTYVLYLGGRDGKGHVKTRDDATHALDGKDMATNLQTAATRTAPFQITDHLGVYNGIIENLEMIEFKPEQWIARVQCRQV